MKAFFNDGKTSKRRDCEIEFHADKLKIRYIDEQQSPLTTLWEISQISRLEVRTSSTNLKYGEYPQEVLELSSQKDLDYIIGKYPDASFHKSTYNTFTTFGWKGLMALVFTLVALSMIFFFYGAPMLAEVFARTIPEEYETYIGRNVQQAYLQYLEVDSSRSQLVQDFYELLDYESNYNVQIVVVESDIANAFALPGGFIVVYSGILEIIEKEDELAALLAHEVSHINGRHSLRMLSRNLSTYLLISILTGDVGGFSSVIIENSHLINNLSFSRTLEKEADISGMRLMIEANIDPQGMVDLFKRFTHLQDSISDSLAERIDVDTTSSFITDDSAKTFSQVLWEKAEPVFSTHPAPKNRIEYLEREMLDSSITNFNGKPSLKGLFESIKSKTDRL